MACIALGNTCDQHVNNGRTGFLSVGIVEKRGLAFSYVWTILGNFGPCP